MQFLPIVVQTLMTRNMDVICIVQLQSYLFWNHLVDRDENFSYLCIYLDIDVLHCLQILGYPRQYSKQK